MLSFSRHEYNAIIEKEEKKEKDIVYQYVMAHLSLAYDKSRRGKKGAMKNLERLGNKLVKQGLLTQEQADELLNY